MWEGWKDERRARPLSASELAHEPDAEPEPAEVPRAEHGAVTWDDEAREWLDSHGA